MEVERFDRIGPHGRRGLISLSAMDAEFWITPIRNGISLNTKGEESTITALCALVAGLIADAQKLIEG